MEYDFAPVIVWTNQIEHNGATLTLEQMESMADTKAQSCNVVLAGPLF